MEYYTLQQSLEWVAFGTLDVPFAEQNNQKEKLEAAKGYLRKAFLTGKVRIASGDKPLPIKPTYDFDWNMNCIYPFEYPGQCLSPTRDKTDIRVSVRDLKREFPRKTPNPKTTTKTPRIYRARPERRTVHDIAYYFWQTNPQLQAKQIYQTLYTTLKSYPEFQNGREPVQCNTVRQWIQGFKNNQYNPATTKEKLSRQYDKVFSKLNDSLK